MYNKKFGRYVPVPEPATSDRIIACHYYSGWQPGGTPLHNGWADLEEFPERTPLLGYYDDTNPEVIDWEIKWACEHGINCFVYCWYRYQSNMGKPVTREALRLGGALHEGLFRARYRSYIKFAIMWECQRKRWGTAKDADDIVNNILPFWIDEYFSKDNYLMIDGKPVVFIYAQKQLIEELGSEEELKTAFERCNEEMKKRGYAGIHFSCMENSVDKVARDDFENSGLVEYYNGKCGFDSGFQYTWPTWYEMLDTEEKLLEYEKTLRVPEDDVIDLQMKFITNRAKCNPEFYMFTNSVMRDSEPWYSIFNINPVWPRTQWQLTPKKWRELLEKTKKVLDDLPEGSIGKKIFMLDNWNEWGEGHFIAPHLGNGFKYLQAVRDVFTERDNIPDYRTPEVLGFGPYDKEWLKRIEEFKNKQNEE